MEVPPSVWTDCRGGPLTLSPIPTCTYTYMNTQSGATLNKIYKELIKKKKSNPIIDPFWTSRIRGHIHNKLKYGVYVKTRKQKN